MDGGAVAYQPRLGPSWFELGGMPVYFPWRWPRSPGTTPMTICWRSNGRTRPPRTPPTRVIDAGLRLDDLRFRYRITGDDPPWRPVRVFDDTAKKLAFNGRDAECVGQVDRLIHLALVFRQAAKQLDEGLQKQREGRQPLLARRGVDVVQLVRMVIDQPELLVIFLNVGGRNLLQSQYAGIVGATVWQIDEILPEGVQLLASPGVTALVVGECGIASP